MIIFFVCSAEVLFAQDETFIRKLFLGEFKEKVDRQKSLNEKYSVYSPLYEFDIDRDNRNEKFVYRFIDGALWFHILDYRNRKIFNYEFDTNGLHARLFRIRIRQLSPAVRVFVLYFYDGFASYLEYKGNARAYFLTIERDNIKSLSMYKGPAIWEEHKDSRVHYHQRAFDLHFVDYNKDGMKEIAFDFYGITRVFMYRGDGRWATPLSRF